MIITDKYFVEPVQTDLFISRENYLLEHYRKMQNHMKHQEYMGDFDGADITWTLMAEIDRELMELFAVNGPNH